MAKRRPLLVGVEKLLQTLLDEAKQKRPAVLDDDGTEREPSRFAVTFGERLRLAETITQYEVRRSKVEEDGEPPEIINLMEKFQEDASGTAAGRAGRKGRHPESNGIANAGRTLADHGPAARIGAPDE